MRLSARSVNALCEVVTGDGGISPYRSGRQLVSLFNEHGADDYYGDGFPSRAKYAEDHLRRLNASGGLPALILAVLDPHEFLDSAFDRAGVCDFLNAHFRFDGFEVVLKDGRPKIRDLKGAEVKFRNPFMGSEDEGRLFIDEQVAKANEKIQAADYDGAITNARSLLEAVLLEVASEAADDPIPYDGDLPKLYKRVQKHLNLDPNRKDVEGPLKQVLGGLAGIVSGIAGVSNKMGDRHARTYRPSKRHALLVVNSAKTIANFLFETQRARRNVRS